jgi:hypothetical protein
MIEYSFTRGDPALGTVYYIFQTGKYYPEDLVPCGKTPDSEQSVVAYQAHYLATGEHI